MSQTEIQASYVKIARDRNWKLVADVKVFDESQTSIVRVFKHGSGQVAVYASHSTDGKNAIVALEPAFASVSEVVRRVATQVGCVSGAADQAIDKLQ